MQQEEKSDGDQAGHWGSRVEPIVFGAVAVLHLVPVWIATAFLTQDGPSHVATASYLTSWFDPEFTLLHQFYVPNPHLAPNWLGHVLLTLFSTVLPPLIAEKVFVSVYVLGLPLAARYAASAFGADRAFVSILAFPFTYNLLLNLGFYNFCCSLVVFFLVLGFWCRREGRFSPGQGAVFALLLLLLYASHGFGTMATMLALGATAAWMALAEARARSEETPVWSGFTRALLPTALACLPIVIIGFSVVGGQDGVFEGRSYPIWYVAQLLFRLDVLVAHAPAILFVSTAFFAFLLGVVVFLLVVKFREGSWNRWDGLLAVTGFMAIVYLVMPAEFINRWANYRFMPFVIFTLILWLASVPHGRTTRVAIPVAAALVSLLIVLFQGMHRRALDILGRDFMSASQHIDRNSTLAPLVFAQNQLTGGVLLSANIKLFLHAAGYLAAERDAIEFTHYEGTKDVFPLRFRPQVDPYVHVGAIESLPILCVNLEQYEQVTGVPIDYVLIWNLPAEFNRTDCAHRVQGELEARYDLIHRSPETGLLWLFERKNRPSG